MITGLMFSGGVDSLVCLKLLREQDVTPVLFHVADYPLNIERKIRRAAKLVSPKSPYYVWGKAEDYKASYCFKRLSCKADYEVYFDSERKTVPVCFSDYVDRLVLGYFKRDNKSMYRTIKECLPRFNNLVFPLADYSVREIDSIWMKFPDEVKINTFSSSRTYSWIQKYIRS
jgi:hypothetical protein